MLYFEKGFKDIDIFRTIKVVHQQEKRLVEILLFPFLSFLLQVVSYSEKNGSFSTQEGSL